MTRLHRSGANSAEPTSGSNELDASIALEQAAATKGQPGRRPTSPPDQKLSLGVMLSASTRGWNLAIEKRFREGYSYTDIRHAHAIVFAHLGRDGNRVSDIAESAGVSKQAVAQTVAYLEEHGYVERAIDPLDGRAKIVRLTERGRLASRAAKKEIARLEAELEHELGATIETLRGALDELSSYLERD